jgi:hypothetical protein
VSIPLSISSAVVKNNAKKACMAERGYLPASAEARAAKEEAKTTAPVVEMKSPTPVPTIADAKPALAIVTPAPSMKLPVVVNYDEALEDCVKRSWTGCNVRCKEGVMLSRQNAGARRGCVSAVAVAVTGVSLVVQAASAIANPVISQVYGGGGNAGATYTHDFVELFNPTAEAVPLVRRIVTCVCLLSA